jgi:hypothetical protein
MLGNESFDDEDGFEGGFELWREKPSNVDELKNKITHVLNINTSSDRFKLIDPDLSSKIDSFLSTHNIKRAYTILESQIAQVQLTDFLRVDPTLFHSMSLEQMMEQRLKNPYFTRVPALNIVTIGVNPYLQRLGIVKALIDYIKNKAQQGGWSIMIIESVINDDFYNYLKTKRTDCFEENSSRSFIFNLK